HTNSHPGMVQVGHVNNMLRPNLYFFIFIKIQLLTFAIEPNGNVAKTVNVQSVTSSGTDEHIFHSWICFLFFFSSHISFLLFLINSRFVLFELCLQQIHSIHLALWLFAQEPEPVLLFITKRLIQLRPAFPFESIDWVIFCSCCYQNFVVFYV